MDGHLLQEIETISGKNKGYRFVIVSPAKIGHETVEWPTVESVVRGVEKDRRKLLGIVMVGRNSCY